MTEKKAGKRPLGVVQVATLKQFAAVDNNRWWKFKPARSGEPWLVMKSLMRRGLMAVHRQRRCYWHPENGWEKEARLGYYAAVTMAGELVLKTLAGKP